MCACVLYQQGGEQANKGENVCVEAEAEEDKGGARRINCLCERKQTAGFAKTKARCGQAHQRCRKMLVSQSQMRQMQKKKNVGNAHLTRDCMHRQRMCTEPSASVVLSTNYRPKTSRPCTSKTSRPCTAQGECKSSMSLG